MICEPLRPAATSGQTILRLARPAVLLPLALLALLRPDPATAQQWLLTPEIEIAAQWIDNPRLQEDGEDDGTEADTRSITGGLVDAGLALRRNTETSSFMLRPRVAVYRYTDDDDEVTDPGGGRPDEDSEAYFLDFAADGEGRRNAWRLLGNYRQQQVFRGETTSADFEDPVEDDVQTGTGRTFERRQRDLWRIQPGFTTELTEVTSVALDLSYLDVSYDAEELGEAVDYNSTRLDASLVRALSPYNQLELGVFAGRYEPSAGSRETDSAGALIRYEQSTSDISTLFVEVGAQEARTDSQVDPDVEISETSFLWSLGYIRRLEVTTWRFELGQDVTPSGSGSLVERDLYRIVMDHQFQPRWTMGLGVVALNTDAAIDEGVVTPNEREYLQGRATLGWRWTPSWTVEGRYTLTHQDFDDIPGDAQEHEVRLSFIYRPPLPTE